MIEQDLQMHILDKITYHEELRKNMRKLRSMKNVSIIEMK